MEEENRLANAARELVASLPPLTPEVRRELTARLRAIAAQKAAQEPAAVAQRQSLRAIRAEMRRACERYLGGEITLRTLSRQLRLLEEEQRNLRPSS